jgi:hypothetical protein
LRNESMTSCAVARPPCKPQIVADHPLFRRLSAAPDHTVGPRRGLGRSTNSVRIHGNVARRPREAVRICRIPCVRACRVVRPRGRLVAGLVLGTDSAACGDASDLKPASRRGGGVLEGLRQAAGASEATRATSTRHACRMGRRTGCLSSQPTRRTSTSLDRRNPRAPAAVTPRSTRTSSSRSVTPWRVGASTATTRLAPLVRP